MFAAHCRHHGTEVLLSERRIVSLQTTAEQHVVQFRCWCGTIGSFHEPIRRPWTVLGRPVPA